MAFRPRPETFYSSGRIDYDAVSERMRALSVRCAEAADMPAFVAIVHPVTEAIIAEHLYIMTDAEYREGEMGSLLGHLEDWLNVLIPSHLPWVAKLADDEFRFYRKEDLPPCCKPQ